MTAVRPPAPPLTDAEAATVARFEAAPYPLEVNVARVKASAARIEALEQGHTLVTVWPPAPDLTPTEAATVARFEQAEPAPESLRRRVVVATHAAVCACAEEDPSWSSYWRKIADAAIATMREAPRG